MDFYFAGIAGMKIGYIIAGLIWSVALGFAAGNYACSLVHRLPRGRAILENKPYCGECRKPLATRDLFPVFSALLLRHRCRYCKTPFPVSHTWTEILVGLLFALCFLQFNFSQEYLLVALLGTFLITLACIDANEKRIIPVVVIAAMVSAMVLRTLWDGEIYGFVQGGFFGGLIGLLIWRKRIVKVNHIYTLPNGALLLVLAGMCVGKFDWLIVLPLFAFLQLILWSASRVLYFERMPMTIALGFCIMVPILFPQASLQEALALRYDRLEAEYEAQQLQAQDQEAGEPQDQGSDTPTYSPHQI